MGQKFCGEFLKVTEEGKTGRKTLTWKYGFPLRKIKVKKKKILYSHWYFTKIIKCDS